MCVRGVLHTYCGPTNLFTDCVSLRQLLTDNMDLSNKNVGEVHFSVYHILFYNSVQAQRANENKKQFIISAPCRSLCIPKRNMCVCFILYFKAQAE